VSGPPENAETCVYFLQQKIGSFVPQQC